MKVNKRMVFAYPVTYEGQVITICEKLPVYVNTLIGADFSVAGLFNLNENDVPQMGEISLELNHRQIHPLNRHIGYSKELSDSPVKYLPLNEPMLRDNVMTGFYRDLSTKGVKREFSPYTVRVYLKFSRR
jgi:hypothetical protein